MLSVIIPTLDEAQALGPTLDAVARLGGPVEVLVVDGGSGDGTVNLARARGASVLTAPRGRGSQQHAGARAATGDVFWFLHADTLPPADAAERITAALADPVVVAGHFAIRFDGPDRSARLLTWLYPHLSWLGLCYGDSGIFVRRSAYERAGGFRAHPLFEDLDLLGRLRRLGRVVRLSATVVTSSRRFEGRNFALVFTWWSILQLLYWLGISPRVLAGLYAPLRRPGRRSGHVRTRPR
jgi:rSAM/selenodomain-associated transferase 2